MYCNTQIEKLREEPWFHGYITAEEANKRLEATMSTGTYLVRLSTTSPGKPYTLSILIAPTQIDHRYCFELNIKSDVSFSSNFLCVWCSFMKTNHSYTSQRHFHNSDRTQFLFFFFISRVGQCTSNILLCLRLIEKWD